MKILLVRHGETNYNKNRLIQGHSDIELNEDNIVNIFVNIVPLSQTSPEKIESIREWGKERAVPASGRPIGEEELKKKIIESRNQKLSFELAKKPKESFLDRTETYSKEELVKILNKKITAGSWKALYENYIVAKPEITDINMIDSIEKLKNSFTNLKEAKEKISKILNRAVVASSWQVLYDKYVTEDLYFKDKVSKYIFYLVEIEGKPQLDFLGITYEYYSNKKVAEKWHKEMIKLIHPDRCKHPKATEAMQALEKLYKGMI